MDKLVISVKEVAECLGIGTNQAYNLVKKDDFPKLKIGQQYLIPKNEFEKWIEKNSYAGVNK